MRSKKALINIIVSLILQGVSIVCGLIVPRLIITTYGSSVNGLIASINQFLGYIVLLEAGVGGVVRAALYKPLANNDINSTSAIIKATERFFKKVACIFILYLLLLSFVFPYVVNSEFNTFFTAGLVLIIGISTFFQYYFGLSYQVLLQADQKRYVTSILQIATMIINAALIIILIRFGTSIHAVKLGSSMIFVLRPILLNRYVNKKYKIVRDSEPDNESIKQRWDGLGHHIAFLLHDNTDIALLTIFANIREVSVYSVYYMIVCSMRGLTATFASSIEAAFGNMIANDEKAALNKNFRLFEFCNFSITTILFTSTAILILPFILLYTSEVKDVNYYRPVFAYILIAAEAVYCIRSPYNSVVLAAGHYKQTRNGAFIEAAINIILSIILVNYFGIEGVAIGTLSAMLFRTIQYEAYLSKNILNRSIFEFIKRIIVYSLAAILIIVVINLLPTKVIDSFTAWIVYAVEVVFIASLITFITDGLFYLDEMKNVLSIIKRIFKKK